MTASPFDALKPLAGRALQEALNRLVALDPDTASALAALDGRRIGLALEAPPVALDIRVDGGRLHVGPPTQEPDLGVRATISGVLSQLPFLRRDGAPPVGKVRINGDAELARRDRHALLPVGRVGRDLDGIEPFLDERADVIRGFVGGDAAQDRDQRQAEGRGEGVHADQSW